MEGRRARSAQPSDRVGGVLRPAVLSGRRRPGCRQGCPYWNGQGPRWTASATGGRHPRRPARVHVDPRRGWLDDAIGCAHRGGFAVELPEGWQPGTVATDVPEEMVFRCQCVRRERWSPDVRDQVPPSGCDRAPARDGRPFGRVRRGRKRHARASGGVATKLCLSGQAMSWPGKRERSKGRSLTPDSSCTARIMRGTGYQFVFALPAGDGSFESDADYIARSISWTADAA